MAKAKSKKTVIKLISSAGTGFMKYCFRLRTAPPVKQVRYDPVAARHVLFTEYKKRRGAVSLGMDFAKFYGEPKKSAK
ncbi:hypothetical protein BABINDRAFT_7012 [Babjeviella inositovora NRRL Y-12698]|uniref:Large ribosomal subunit protein bL33m n=1 Tax=Babjeviella inositovora NRRL Y-12698 TaxID=984486 RepID=A0A1E3QU49_9ASCO|nr:uncharacterized protein BABINDRAFT_7012 [Babjeviella inositovora NRRL Y-12698]ODQ81189.1 hypothetical protein BABINDRAFT_7012 [Babjeviella inositovora NRRL Y-12698]